MTTLKALAWDHPRGYAGLKALSAEVGARIGATLEWHVHSLEAFSADPLAEVAQRYDLVLFDHPFSGTVCRDGILLDLRPRLDPAFLADLRSDAVGFGVELFEFDQGLWGLPLDAAAQVAAYRPDLCDCAGLDEGSLSGAPLEEIIARLKAQNLRLAISLTGVGSLMCFFTYCYQYGAPPFADGRMAPREPGIKAIDALRRILDASPHEVLDWISTTALEQMSRRDDLAYCPCIFGFAPYSSDAYGRQDGRRPLQFTDGPAAPGGQRRGSIIGGAGIGVSAVSPNPDIAVRAVEALMSRDIQRDMALHLGQPGRRSTWTDQAVNAATRNFYANTLHTIEQGYIRPRVPDWVPLQDTGGQLLEAHLRKGSAAGDIVSALEDHFASLRIPPQR